MSSGVLLTACGLSSARLSARSKVWIAGASSRVARAMTMLAVLGFPPIEYPRPLTMQVPIFPCMLSLRYHGGFSPMNGGAAWQPGQNSNLFYQSRARRPLLDRAEGIYLWDVAGKRYIDGSSGAMVSNIGHSNPRVLDAMRRQMARATFGYRLHFENEPAERLGAPLAALAPARHDKGV